MNPNYEAVFGLTEQSLGEDTEPQMFFYISSADTGHELFKFYGSVEIADFPFTLNSLMERFPGCEVMPLPEFVGQYVDGNGNPPSGASMHH